MTLQCEHVDLPGKGAAAAGFQDRGQGRPPRTACDRRTGENRPGAWTALTEIETWLTGSMDEAPARQKPAKPGTIVLLPLEPKAAYPPYQVADGSWPVAGF